MARASANPNDFKEGGLWAGVGTIKAVLAHLFTYPGGTTQTSALQITIEHGDGDYEQEYSAGDPKRLYPSEDGKGFEVVEDGATITKSSNLGMFMAAAVNAGFPAAPLGEGDFSVLIGTKAKFARQPMPQREGLANPAGGAQKKDKGPATILLIAEIQELPKALQGKGGAKATATAAPKTTTTATPAAPASAPAADTGDLDAKVIAYAAQVVAAAGGPVKKKDIAMKVFQAMAKEPPALRTPASKRVVEPAFLEQGMYADADGNVALLYDSEKEVFTLPEA